MLKALRSPFSKALKPAVSSQVEVSKLLQSDKMNYGCGYDKRDGYLNVDAYAGCDPDFLIEPGDFSKLPKRHFGEIFARDVLEHIPRPQTLRTLLEFASMMRRGGTLIVQTSSILHVADRMRENPSFADHYGWSICLFGNQAHEGDYHQTGFTDATLTVHLAAAGFSVLTREVIEGWMFKFDCEKTSDWDQLLDDPSLSNEAFLAQAYEQQFERPVDANGIGHFGGQLARGVDRRSVLLDITSSPERLYVVSRRLGL
jgi:hypothetical protein